MIVSEIIARIQDKAPNAFALVEGAGELSVVKDRPPASPACYVVASREESGDNGRATGVLQRVEMDISVVIIVDNVSDARGAAARSDIEPLKKFVRSALIGWQPAGAEDVVTHVSGELTISRGGTVWWEETFATAHYLEMEGDGS